jgi:signal transduction histidine kinase/ligand-binding sensor domain-containing protein
VRLGRRLSLYLSLAWCLTAVAVLRGENHSNRAPAASPPQARINTATISYPMIDGADIRFSRPNAPEGLSLTKLGPIVQDNQGFLWFGSQHGLYRFDGYSYKEFVHDPTNASSLSGVFITTLFKDRNGTLWVGCDRFLDRFDLETETFTHYSVPFVVHISQDRPGLLWLSTPSGLYGFDPTSGRSRRYAHNPADPMSLSSNNVRSSGEDREGRLWVSSSEGMDEFDRSSGKVLLHIPLSEPSSSCAFFEDRLGTFWIYRNSGNPLAIFDRKSNTLTEFSFDKSGRTGGAPTSVTAMIEDGNGTLWLGKIGAGLLKLDREHKRLIRYRNNIANAESIGEDSIGYLALDREGMMWAALGGMGLTSFAVKALPFKRYRHDFGDLDIKGEPFVGAIFEDETGTLWIGAHEALNRIDKQPKLDASYALGGAGEGSDVIAITEDRSGTLWIGTYGHGLFRFDRKTARFKRYRHDPADRYSLSDDIVPRLLVDHNGILWAATDDGLDRYDAVRDRFTTYRRSQQIRDHYLEIVEDSQGIFWLGTDSSGMQQFDPATGRFTTYEHDSARTGSLSDNRVNSIHFDRAGRVWVGTQDGLHEFDARAGRFTTYNRRDGLSGSTVGCVLEDERGNLWMSTNNGVANFDVGKRLFKGYSTADGLPGLDLTGWGACFKSPSGEMYFGGFAGATSFFPDQVQESSYVPPVVLTDFRVSGASVIVGPDSILKKTINYTDRITLNYKQNIFSIGFSALSFANPGTNRYRYMLEGLDRSWNEVGSDQRLASYTTLPHGVYRFRVEGAESHGAWTQPGREITIEILPPWWLSGWFRAVCVLAALLILWMLYQVRLEQLKHQFNAALEARVDERTRIARELHDTLLQSFNSLLLRFQSAANILPGRPDEAKQRIDSAIEQASDAIAEGRDAVHQLRAGALSSIDLDQAIGNFAKELLGGSTVDPSPEFQVQVEGTPRPLNPIVRDEVYRIGVEALSNAFRHAEALRIEVEIRYGEHELRLRIRDNGKGIDAATLGREHSLGHWGLRGMRERARLVGGTLEVWSQLNIGTEIDLNIPAANAYAKSPVSRWSILSRFRRS